MPSSGAGSTRRRARVTTCSPARRDREKAPPSGERRRPPHPAHGRDCASSGRRRCLAFGRLAARICAEPSSASCSCGCCRIEHAPPRRIRARCDRRRSGASGGGRCRRRPAPLTPATLRSVLHDRDVRHEDRAHLAAAARQSRRCHESAEVSPASAAPRRLASCTAMLRAAERDLEPVRAMAAAETPRGRTRRAARRAPPRAASCATGSGGRGRVAAAGPSCGTSPRVGSRPSSVSARFA